MGTPSTPAKTTAAAAWTTMEPKITDRRPAWSESEPTMSRASRMATAYTPKITVVVIGEKCHFRWYVA
ncbi:hypothetical protein QR300_41985 [Streptomyces antimycoticus]|nr:hypothetical protein [Streptomyces antimycoticus]WJE01959.1 hypothetical protein QR300_41985 [Streptomyces antimycoticus]